MAYDTTNTEEERLSLLKSIRSCSLFDYNIDPDENIFHPIYDNRNVYVTSDELNELTGRLASDHFSFLHVNCRSLKNKLHDLVILLHWSRSRILAVTETWLDDNSSLSVEIPGFVFVSRHRVMKKGGGVGFFIDSDLKYSVLDVSSWSVDITSFEILLISAECRGIGSFTVGVIYRPPDTNIRVFNAELSNILDYVDRKNMKIFLLGDFNIDFLDKEWNSLTAEFFNLLASHCLLPAFTTPTRKCPSTATAIDNIFTNYPLQKTLARIVLDDVSDHFPIFLSATLSTPDCVGKNHVFSLRRSFVNKEIFEQTLHGSDWSRVIEVAECGDASSAYSMFINRYLEIYNNSFPLVSCSGKSNGPNKFDKEWMTPKHIKSCKKKNALYRAYTRNPSPSNKQKFTTFRNLFKSTKVKTIKQFYSEKFKLNNNNMKGTWKLIGNILNKKTNMEQCKTFCTDDGSLLTSSSVIAESFNNYFSNIGSNLARKISPPDTTFEKYLGNPVTHSFYVAPTTPDEIIKIASNLKISHSCGPMESTHASHVIQLRRSLVLCLP